MITGEPPDCAVARMACSRRSASALSSSARVAKRRTSIFIGAPSAGVARPLGDFHFHVELGTASLVAKGQRRAGFAAGNTCVGVLGGSHRDFVDGEEKIAGLEAGLLPGADVEVRDHD